jgi:hypothetical protein
VRCNYKTDTREKITPGKIDKKNLNSYRGKGRYTGQNVVEKGEEKVPTFFTFILRLLRYFCASWKPNLNLTLSLSGDVL